MKFIGGKHDRILAIYNNLLEGKRIDVKSAADYYGVSTKTIKRDIDDIRNFFAEKEIFDGGRKEVLYDRHNNNYYLDGSNKLTSKEIFALCKVLIESRAFCKKEFLILLDKVIERCAFDDEIKHIKEMISNERFHYTEPIHRKELLDIIWELSVAIKQHRCIRIKYGRLTEPKNRERIVEPVGIMFSDYYFYLTAYIQEKETKNPTIYRIDRILEYEVLDDTFSIPYINRFEEGEFRKRIQFMYGGDLLRLEFKYFGESPEAIIDRLPTAEIIRQDDSSYTFRAEVFGRGIKPWLLGQADKIEVLKPQELRDEMKNLISTMLLNYKD